ncbi:hypothetical protein [Chryseobacterium lathyri]|uniref:Uncharacterized protein n=1 Tax=Chryseobacterium lathyri TaxID=395933 RepID=A0ABT9SIB6_9FLAO|nr:hypothetical protein [Chryseobacterium lathyri]MDP9959162.1 hypothetical protein [Chryseobacterium lathyri]
MEAKIVNKDKKITIKEHASLDKKKLSAETKLKKTRIKAEEIS